MDSGVCCKFRVECLYCYVIVSGLFNKQGDGIFNHWWSVCVNTVLFGTLAAARPRSLSHSSRATISLGTWWTEPSFLTLQEYLGYAQPCVFTYKFQGQLINSHENPLEIPTEILLSVWDWHLFKKAELPIHKHDISFHLLIPTSLNNGKWFSR